MILHAFDDLRSAQPIWRLLGGLFSVSQHFLGFIQAIAWTLVWATPAGAPLLPPS